MKPQFQADNDLRNAIRVGVLRREPSISFQTAFAAKLDGVKDPEVLLLAASEGRILVSHDENSLPGHFRDFLAAGHHSPGVFLVRQGAPIGAVIESIVMLWVASEADEWKDRIEWLPF